MKVFCYDHLSPQDIAKTQALYSRSPRSVEDHMAQVEREGSAKFMSRWYVEYGHQSIGDCGSTTLFFEDVSLLFAKAIQDNPLYSGQETSTRYLDFAERRIHDPIDTPTSRAILASWMDFYRAAQPDLLEHLRRQHPRQEGQDEGQWEKALLARRFDILRGFLPAGATTQLSWHTNLRQAADVLARLRQHPLAEVGAGAAVARKTLEEKYPESFGHRERPEIVEWQGFVWRHYYHEEWPEALTLDPLITDATLDGGPDVATMLEKRPRGGLLPQWTNDLGRLTFEFLLDFGSFRDLQRHRALTLRMPLLVRCHGFHPWYLDQLPAKWRDTARVLLARQEKAIGRLDSDSLQDQYLYPLGNLVPVRFSAGLPGLVYLAELRTSKTVHPTLRAPMQEVARMLCDEGIPVHYDTDPSDWDIKRGAQDILEVKP